MEEVVMRGNTRRAVTTKQTEWTLTLVMMTPPKGLEKDKKTEETHLRKGLKTQPRHLQAFG